MQKSYNYKIVDSSLTSDVSELNEYIFIVHKHIDKLNVVLLWMLLTLMQIRRLEKLLHLLISS